MSLAGVTLVGVGKMGEAVLAGLVNSRGPVGITVVNQRVERDEELQSRYGVTPGTLPSAVDDCGVVVVAVKPKDITHILDEISGRLDPRTVVVSLAAGVPLSVMAAHLPAGQPVVRVMPNTPSLMGQGISALSPGSTVTNEQLARVREVMGSCGRVVVVPEGQQDAVTAVSGSGPAYIFAVAEAMIEAGVQMGLTRKVATQLASQTIVGAGTMLVASGEHPSILRENVTSPGGTTAQALKVLDQHAVRAAFSEAMLACAEKSAAMARAVVAAEGV